MNKREYYLANKTKIKQRMRERYANPEIRRRVREYQHRPEIQERLRAYRQHPEIKEWKRKYHRAHSPHIKTFEEQNKIDYCQACGFKQFNGMLLDIHHLDNNEENNAVENLVKLCPTCHVYLIHRCGFTFEQVKEIRR